MATKTRMQGVRAKRHARRLAQDSLRRAGTLKAVGQAMRPPRTESTVGHYVTDRTHPDLKRAFELLVGLAGAEDVSARPFAEAALEAVELADIVRAETETLVERAIYLRRSEHTLEAAENESGQLGCPAYPAALRREAHAQLELASILEELAYRGVDFYAAEKALLEAVA